MTMNRLISHEDLIRGKFEDWVPPPKPIENLIVMPVETNPLPRHNKGFDQENLLCYRILCSSWWNHYHWRLKNGWWFHCRSKFSYEAQIKYACTVDGEYKDKKVKWFCDYRDAIKILAEVKN